MNPKHVLIKAALVVPTAALAVFGITSAASASNGPSTSKSVTVKATGRAAFKYTDLRFGQVRVNETHHGGCQAGNFDTLGATLTTPDLADAGQTITVGWISDFYRAGLITGCDTQVGYAVVTVSLDGLSYSGNAYYPNG